MKKLSIIFSLVFFAFVVTASAQSAVSSDKQSTSTEKVKSSDTKAKAGCCAYSTKDCKAGSAKCCSMDKAKAEKSHAGCSGHAEATTVNEQKAVAEAEKK